MRAIFDAETVSPDRPSESHVTFDALFDEALGAYLRQDHRAALTLFEEALRLRPDDPTCLNNVRVLEQRLGRN